MVMECNYGGGLFLEFQPLSYCMLCEGVRRPYCRLYYSLWGLVVLCAGCCVEYVLGRVVFSGFLSKYGVDAGMVVRTILLYVVIYCMFNKSLRCCLYHSAETRLRMGPRYWLLCWVLLTSAVDVLSHLAILQSGRLG